jgi:hypothetical protein
VNVNALLIGAASVFALCVGSANAANLIANGGFEDGVYTAVDSSTNAENSGVPVSWDPNDAFIDYSGFNGVRGYPYSGSYSLQMGDFDSQPEAELSQTFSDVAGQKYTVSFYGYDGGANGDPNADLTVSVGSASTSFNDTVSTYTLGTFTFVGQGSDTLTIAAKTNPSDWYVDNVAVTAASVSAAPEPSTWLLMIAGIGGIGLMLRRTNGVFRFGASSAVAA